ncbi:MAG: response regulator [Deltaproteobacteria bacterium]|nr:response regulator [Deltaproteobacteria bacterium]
MNLPDGKPASSPLTPSQSDERSSAQNLLTPDLLLLEAALTYSATAQLLCDPSGHIAFANEEFKRLLRRNEAELHGQSLDTVIQGKYGELLKRASQAKPLDPTLANVLDIVAASGKRGDGTSVPLLIRPASFRNDRGLHLVLSCIDATDQERLRTESARRLSELERSNRRLEDFAGLVAHDLKAPLRAMSISAGWIAEDTDSTLSRQSTENLERLQTRVLRLGRLIDDLLDYCRMDSESNIPETFGIREIVDDVIHLLDVPPSMKVEVRTDVEYLRTWRKPLERVLQNLVDNAVKHHPHAVGRVTVSVRNLGSFVEVVVRDDGDGIPPEYHRQIFEMFTTLKSKNAVQGSGMGLCFAKKIVEAHGGQLQLESAVGLGAAFTFAWPRLKPTESENVADAVLQPAEDLSGPITILLIEDDDIEVEAVLRSFRKRRIANQVVVARDALEALEILHANDGRVRPPFVIFLDLNLPRVSGFEFLARLRNDPDLCSTTVYVLTTSNARFDRLRAQEHCVAGYMLKDELDREIEKLISTSSDHWLVEEGEG